MTQLKPPTAYNQQWEKLRSRGCQISDIPVCEKILSRINYYRLSAYFLPFKRADGNYMPGTDFNTVYQIYEFDRKLRNPIFAAIAEVEIYLWAKFAYYHTHEYGVLGYMDAANYNQRHRHDRFKELIETETKNNRKVLFVQHHIPNCGRRTVSGLGHNGTIHFRHVVIFLWRFTGIGSEADRQRPVWDYTQEPVGLGKR
jgi:abortive infection bacteriophage resistance protein